MKPIHRTRRSRAALVLLMLAMASTAQAASARKDQKTTVSASVKFIDAPSSESPAAREKRLRRECRGRPNAGACLGYTR